MKYSFCNGITPQVRWLNSLWGEFYFNKVGEKVGDKLGEKVGEKLGDTQKNIIQRIGSAKGGYWEVKK